MVWGVSVGCSEPAGEEISVSVGCIGFQDHSA